MEKLMSATMPYSLVMLQLILSLSCILTGVMALEDETLLDVSVLSSSSVNVSWSEVEQIPETSPDPIDSNFTAEPEPVTTPLNKSLYTIQFRNNASFDWTTAVSPHTGDSWMIVDGLVPYSLYKFRLVVVTDDGDNSLESDWTRTDMAAPSGKPNIINSPVSDSHSVEFEFEAPPVAEWNGELDGFTLSYTNLLTNVTMSKTLAFGEKKVNVSHLDAYTEYIVQLKAYNKAGDGPAAEFIAETEEDVPSSPRIVNILMRNATCLWVKWEPPRQPNGMLLGYRLYVMSSEEPQRAINVSVVHNYLITGLRAYNGYELQVSGYTLKGEGEPSGVYPIMTDVAAPGVPAEVNVTSNQSDALIVRWKTPLMFTYQVDQYLIVYGVIHENREHLMRVASSDSVINVHEVALLNLKADTVYHVKVAAATRSIDKSDVLYTGPYSDVKEVATLSSDGGYMSNTAIGIIAGVIATLVIILAIVIVILVRHCVKSRYQFIADQDLLVGEKSSTQPNLALTLLYDAQACSHRDALSVDNFEEHVASLHADSDYLLSQEYEEINHQAPTCGSTLQSLAEDNKHKNRYLNILAYDHSRVILKQVPSKPRSDYINGNYIDGYKKQKAYIATQGPLPCTFGDFWRMVWEQESVIIVMITNLMEKGRRKCDQYWPTEGEQLYDGGLLVHLLSTSVTAHYTVRMFSLRLINRTLKKRCSSLVGSSATSSIYERIVYQYHYTDWPDHGVPAYTLPTLAFVTKSAAANPPSAGPIIVHCSAGVGRTGTYIVLDSMMRQIKDIQTVNVFGFLSHIRNQRSYVVQTEDQYSFIHDALVEFIRSGGETEVKDVNLSQYVRQLTTADESGNTGLRTQYELVTSFEVKPFHFQSALSTVNEPKNRSTSVLPVELSRVHLPARAGVEGSDYINASFLQGYTRNDEFIITQHPISETVADFWNMIWDQNSITIVLLSSVDDMEYKAFWPQPDDNTMDFGNFHVLFQSQTVDGVYTSTEFLLQSTQDDYECVVKMVACSCWPASFTPLRNVFELIHKVKAWHAEHEQTQGPVIVVDQLGGVSAAAFCALMTLYDALHHEASIDVYTVAKLYCLKRPQIFPTEDDYLFLYKAVESLCNEEETCVAGDRDSGIANCNNYSVNNHQPPSSPTDHLQPTSPPTSPSPGSAPTSLPGSPRSAAPLSPNAMKTVSPAQSPNRLSLASSRQPEALSPGINSQSPANVNMSSPTLPNINIASPHSPGANNVSPASTPSLEQHAVMSIL